MRFSLLSQLRNELQSIWSGYPNYVYSGRAPAQGGHVPVFVYHTIRPSSFEADLQYLSENGYTPIGMDDLVRHLTGEQPAPERAVVLTFDDARSSFWRFGYPLLRRYEMRGVLFVIAGLTPDAASVRENLFSVWDGDRTVGEVDALDPDDATLCTWPELKEMYGSGRVEIESHSLFHREVFVDTEIVDFLGPGSTFVPFHTSATPYLSPGDAGTSLVPEEYYGLPLFQTAPLFKGVRAWEPSDALIRTARQLWSEVSSETSDGGTRRQALRARWNDLDHRQEMRRQPELDVEQDIAEDIDRARQLIKEQIGPEAGDHFCLPYTVGSAVSIRIMRELDLESCSWGVMEEDRHNTAQSDPMRVSRVKADFLWRLPGRSQKSLARVYGEKIERRLRGDRVF